MTDITPITEVFELVDRGFDRIGFFASLHLAKMAAMHKNGWDDESEWHDSNDPEDQTASWNLLDAEADEDPAFQTAAFTIYRHKLINERRDQFTKVCRCDGFA